MYKKDGFTIIELLVVIAVIGVVATFSFASYSSIEDELSLEREMGEILGTVNTARDYAIASWYPKEGFLEDYLEDEDNAFHGGYGVAFDVDSSTYKLFADLEDEEGGSIDDVEIIETFEMEEVMSVESVDIDGSAEDRLYVVFRPPDLLVFFNGEDAIENDSEAVITFSYGGLDYTREISINPYGVSEYKK